MICDAVRAAGRAGLAPGGRDRLATGFPALVLPELGGGEVETGNLGATFEAAARYLGPWRAGAACWWCWRTCTGPMPPA